MHPDLSKSIVEEMRNYDVVHQGLDTYPDFPYHNRKHGVDVIEAACEWAPKCGFEERQIELLVLAAAWHDAGFGHDEEVWKPHGSKEAYAALLMWKAAKNQYSEEELAFAERAILGTKMGPDVIRDTSEAKFLHLMDLSYLWADQEEFLRGVMAVRKEEFPGLNTKQFLDLQHKFLPSYREELVSFLNERNVSPEKIEELARRIDENLAAIDKELKRELASTGVGAAALAAAIAS